MIRAPQVVKEVDLPGSITRDSEFIAADNAHLAAIDPHPQYMEENPTGIEFAQATFNYLDFHTSTPKDFDARIIVTGGGSVNAQATMLIQCALLQLNTSFSLNGAAQLSRLLSTAITVDLPAIAAGGSTSITQNISGATIGDVCFFNPTQMPAGLVFLKIMAIISATGVATVHFHNMSSNSLDISPFLGRLLVFGFAP